LKIQSILKAGSGTIITAVIFILTTPKIFNDFGVERFGYISLLLVLFSSASLLDLGLARGVTYFVSNNKIKNKTSLSIIWQVAYFLLFWSLAIGLLAYILLTKYFGAMNNIPGYLQLELLSSTTYISLTFVFVVMHSIFRGVLEGFEFFGITSVIKVVMASFIFVMLYLSQYFESTILYSAQVFCLVRLLMLLVMVKLVAARIRPVFIYKWSDIREIVAFSWKVSISSLSSTALNYIDRFLGGSFANPILFGSYSLISDTVMRILFIPGAIGGVLYPSLSTFEHENNRQKLQKATLYVVISIVPVLLLLNVFGQNLLKYWLSNDFDNINLSLYILVLSIGIFFLSLSQIYYGYIQGLGFVSFTARLHFIELIVFIPIFVIAAKNFGLDGIIFIWLLRIIVDFLCLFLYKNIVMGRERLSE